jgi:hypothetical protein
VTDAIVLYAEKRYDELIDEIDRLESALALYVGQAGAGTSVQVHYNVRHSDEAIETCGCGLCHDWRVRRAEVERMAPFVEGHERGCQCGYCRVERQLRFGFLGSVNRRDLWTEMTYHTELNKDFRQNATTVLQRLRRELENPERTQAWWAIEGGRLPMGFWFRRVQPSVLIETDA